jgi:hypothetical protein
MGDIADYYISQQMFDEPDVYFGEQQDDFLDEEHFKWWVTKEGFKNKKTMGRINHTFQLDTSIMGDLMLKAKKEPLNRSERRSYNREKQRLENFLIEVEMYFNRDLFNEEFNHISYQDVYEHFLFLYKRRCDWVNTVKKPRWFKVREDYFKETFKPIV